MDNDEVKEGENPREKFKRVGNARLNRALDSIEMLESLAGPTYDYDDEQVTVIQEELLFAVDRLVGKLKARGRGRALL